jgi:hypothetical protein
MSNSRAPCILHIGRRAGGRGGFTPPFILRKTETLLSNVARQGTSVVVLMLAEPAQETNRMVQ